MCGRFTQTQTWAQLVELYALDEALAPAALPPRYNVAPTQDVAVVRRIEGRGERELVALRWGLVPFWSKSIDIGARMINARAETVAEKPAFRAAFRARRCLIVADGFYEWQKRPSGPKQPYYITAPPDRPFAFAGLWESWAPPGGQALQTCTIITTRATAALQPIHDRMPVMLAPADFDAWLAPDLPSEAAAALLGPTPHPLITYPVTRHVNAVRNDDPSCVERLAEA